MFLRSERLLPEDKGGLSGGPELDCNPFKKTGETELYCFSVVQESDLVLL